MPKGLGGLKAFTTKGVEEEEYRWLGEVKLFSEILVSKNVPGVLNTKIT